MKATRASAGLSAALFLAIGSATLSAQEAEDFDPMTVSEADAIGCRLDAAQYNGFALSVSGPDGIAAARKWRKIRQPNAFLEEYELPAPITVAGHATRRIAFSANALVAVLDLADPNTVAAPEGVTNAVGDAAAAMPLLASEGSAFRKFMGERVLVDRTDPAAQDGGFGTHEIVARTISNVVTHPGKTLYGCSYRIAMLDGEGNPL